MYVQQSPTNYYIIIVYTYTIPALDIYIQLNVYVTRGVLQQLSSATYLCVYSELSVLSYPSYKASINTNLR